MQYSKEIIFHYISCNNSHNSNLTLPGLQSGCAPRKVCRGGRQNNSVCTQLIKEHGFYNKLVLIALASYILCLLQALDMLFNSDKIKGISFTSSIDAIHAYCMYTASEATGFRSNFIVQFQVINCGYIDLNIHTNSLPALYQPKDIFFEGGLEPTQMANREMRNPARSESM